MNDKIYTHSLSLQRQIHASPFSPFDVFQEHFLNKHIRANMQIDTKKTLPDYKRSDRRREYLIFHTFESVNSTRWTGDNMP